jgi:hypothetical protein
MKTQTFNHLPDNAYYTTGKNYSGLTKKENFESNNTVRLGSIATIKRLKK